MGDCVFSFNQDPFSNWSPFCIMELQRNLRLAKYHFLGLQIQLLHLKLFYLHNWMQNQLNKDHLNHQYNFHIYHVYLMQIFILWNLSFPVQVVVLRFIFSYSLPPPPRPIPPHICRHINTIIVGMSWRVLAMHFKLLHVLKLLT